MTDGLPSDGRRALGAGPEGRGGPGGQARAPSTRA
jgi:hypothetical protein